MSKGEVTVLVVLVTVLVILSLLYYSMDSEAKHKSNPDQCDSLQDVSLTTGQEEGDGLDEEEVSREQGLQILEGLIRKKPNAENCEDVLSFLTTFRDNKKKWKVSRKDLHRIYRSVEKNIFTQLGQLRLSKRCTKSHGGVSAFTG